MPPRRWRPPATRAAPSPRWAAHRLAALVDPRLAGRRVAMGAGDHGYSAFVDVDALVAPTTGWSPTLPRGRPPAERGGQRVARAVAPAVGGLRTLHSPMANPGDQADACSPRSGCWSGPPWSPCRSGWAGPAGRPSSWGTRHARARDRLRAARLRRAGLGAGHPGPRRPLRRRPIAPLAGRPTGRAAPTGGSRGGAGAVPLHAAGRLARLRAAVRGHARGGRGPAVGGRRAGRRSTELVRDDAGDAGQTRSRSGRRPGWSSCPAPGSTRGPTPTSCVRWPRPATWSPCSRSRSGSRSSSPITPRG